MTETTETAAPAATPPAAPAPAAGAASSPAEAAAAQPPTSPPPRPPMGIFDAVADDGTDKRKPDWLPEQFWDAQTGEAKWEALARSWSDLRTKIARGQGRVPDHPDGYTLPRLDGVPEVSADDPLWSEVRRAAHQAGVTQAQLEALARAYLGWAAQRQPAAAVDPKAAYEAEIAKLGPTGRAVVRDVGGWVNGLVARGVLTAEEADSLRAVADAAGVRALGKLKALLGEKPIPLEALDDGRMSRADAERMLREAIRQRDDTLGQKALRALRELAAQQAHSPNRS